MYTGDRNSQIRVDRKPFTLRVGEYYQITFKKTRNSLIFQYFSHEKEKTVEYLRAVYNIALARDGKIESTNRLYYNGAVAKVADIYTIDELDKTSSYFKPIIRKLKLAILEKAEYAKEKYPFEYKLYSGALFKEQDEKNMSK